MTAEEIRKRYNVSAAALKIYEDQVRMVSEENQTKEKDYDDQDLERIGMIMTLGKMGFPDEEIGIFVRMEKEGEITKGQRLGMLKKQRRHMRFIRRKKSWGSWIISGMSLRADVQTVSKGTHGKDRQDKAAKDSG